MKRLAVAICLTACLVFVYAAAASGSSIVVESKTVYDGNSASAGVFLQNDNELRGIGIKLVVRDRGAYPTALQGEYTPEGRLGDFTYLSAIVFTNYYDNEDGTCKDGKPGGFGTISGGGSGLLSVTAPNPTDPDCFLFSRSIIVDGNLPAGDDGDIPSIRINFTCPELAPGADPGDFIIDTTCVNPAGHTLFVLSSGDVDPNLTFTMGTITCEPCDCPHQGDYDYDGQITATDLSDLIDVLYRGAPDPRDFSCPKTRSDLDCDGFSRSLDLAIMVDYLYQGGPGPCEPCAP